MESSGSILSSEETRTNLGFRNRFRFSPRVTGMETLAMTEAGVPVAVVSWPGSGH